MIMDNEKIKHWAEIVLVTLSLKGRLTVSELQEMSGLGLQSVCAVVGWLTWKNRVTFNDNGQLTLNGYHERHY